MVFIKYFKETMTKKFDPLSTIICKNPTLLQPIETHTSQRLEKSVANKLVQLSISKTTPLGHKPGGKGAI